MIVIVTNYKSDNYGSLLQAKMLREALLPFGVVKFLDDKQRRLFGISFLRSILYSLIRFYFRRSYQLFSRTILMKREWKKLPVITKDELQGTDDNLVVIGSDEIWNVSRKECATPLFFGDGLKGRLVSYATSVNNATLEELRRFNAANYLKNLDLISVRDKHSYDVISRLTDKKVCVTLDPTLCFSKEKYLKDIAVHSLHCKYLALYLFGSKNDSYRGNIVRFARENKLKIVSVGTIVPWSDIHISGEDVGMVPFLYFLSADYVVTNTFHGTAFAINFGTKFVSYGKNNKITDLLDGFNLRSRDVYQVGYDEFRERLMNPIDYDYVNSILVKKREESNKYIKQIFV